MSARNSIEVDIKLTEQKHQRLAEKFSELEDRSRRNNLWFSIVFFIQLRDMRM